MAEETKPDTVEVDDVSDKAEEGNGESVDVNRADAAPDYSAIMDKLRELQENQADFSAQLKKISDAQSVLVDSGAVVRELPVDDIKESNTIDNDGFISLDDMDLSI